MKIFNPYDKRSLIKKILGYCDCPYHRRNWFVYPKVIRCNTMYENEADNWSYVVKNFMKMKLHLRLKKCGMIIIMKDYEANYEHTYHYTRT